MMLLQNYIKDNAAKDDQGKGAQAGAIVGTAH